MKTVKQITKDYLTANGFDGLASEFCGCLVDDLMPCDGKNIEHCQAGHKIDCTCGEDCGFHIQVTKTDVINVESVDKGLIDCDTCIHLFVDNALYPCRDCDEDCNFKKAPGC